MELRVGPGASDGPGSGSANKLRLANARVFVRETGMTPAKFVENARIEKARKILEESDVSLDDVAEKCGFGSAERMRRTFLRHLQIAPLDYRRRFEGG